MRAINNTKAKIEQATKVGEWLQAEAQLTKQRYKIALHRTKYGDFVRNIDSVDAANAFSLPHRQPAKVVNPFYT